MLRYHQFLPASPNYRYTTKKYTSARVVKVEQAFKADLEKTEYSANRCTIHEGTLSHSARQLQADKELRTFFLHGQICNPKKKEKKNCPMC